jgi:antitoxin HigA-1
MTKTLRHASIRPCHPGEIIADSIAETGVSKVAAAKALGISRTSIYMLIDQRQSVTAEMALRLEAVLGSTAETWLRLQSEHDLWVARQSLDLSGLTRVA